MADLPASLLTRLDANPYDAPAWRAALATLEALPSAAASPHFARALALFPTSGVVIKAAANAQLVAGDVAGAEATLASHLLEGVDPGLWAFYCSFVVATKLAPAEAAAAAAVAGSDTAAISAAAAACATARAAVLAAFDFAVLKVGSLWGSDELWRSYVSFTGTLPTDQPYLAGQAREARRKALQAAVVTPHAGVDAMYAEFSAYERANSQPKLAEALIANIASSQGTASCVAKERATLWRSIDAAALPAPAPTPDDVLHAPSPDSASELRALADGRGEQVGLWRRVLGYELSNPLHLEPLPHAEAVRTVFRQALAGPLRTCPDAWHDYSVFEGDAGAPAVFTAACTALPTCVTLALAAADCHELAGRHSSAGEAYATLLASLHAVADGGGALRALSREMEGGGGDPATTAPAAAGATSDTDDVVLVAAKPPPRKAAVPYPSLAALDVIVRGGTLVEAYAAAGGAPAGVGASAHKGGMATTLDAAAAAAAALVKASTTPIPKTLAFAILLASPADARDAAAAIPGVFILQQRHARRTGGIDAARAIFAAARRSAYCSAPVFLASARLEYYANGHNAVIARNILAAGRSRFPTCSDYPLCCGDSGGGAAHTPGSCLDALLSSIDFLAAVDDASSVRQTIEAAIAAVPASASRPLFDRLIAYELTAAPDGGSLEIVAALEKRRAAAHPALVGLEARLLLRLAHRWGVCPPLGAPPTTRVDAELLKRHPCGPFATLPLPGMGALERVGDATSAPSALIAALTTAGVGAGAGVKGGAKTARPQVDGLYLQAPLGFSACPVTSTPLSHIPQHALATLALDRISSAVAEGAVPPHTAAAHGGAGSSPAGSAGGGASGWGRGCDVPPPLRYFLSRLPACDHASVPLPDVDVLMRSLLAWGDGGDRDRSRRPSPERGSERDLKRSRR